MLNYPLMDLRWIFTTLSCLHLVQYGVPQGFVLGFTLFVQFAEFALYGVNIRLSANCMVMNTSHPF